MNTRDSRKPRLSDEDIESLLRDFFQQEMPAELRGSDVRWVMSPRRGGPASAGPSHRKAPVFGLAASACALLLAVTALRPAVRHSERREGTADIVSPAEDHRRGVAYSGNTRSHESSSNIASRNSAPPHSGNPPEKSVPVEESWVLELFPVEFREYLQREQPDWWHQFQIEIINPLPEENSPPPSPAANKRPRLPEDGHRR